MDNVLSIHSEGGAQGPRITTLMHALALVKGEMGSQVLNAPYVTMHCRLRSMWDGLKNLKAGLDKQTTAPTSKVEGSRVDKLFGGDIGSVAQGQ